MYCGLFTGKNQANQVPTLEKDYCHRDDTDQDSDFLPLRASESGEDMPLEDENSKNPSTSPKGNTD